jgi:cytochrome P450
LGSGNIARMNATAPRLAMPPRLPGRLPLYKVIRAIGENAVAVWTDDAFEMDWMDRSMWFRRLVVANTPEAAKHVLLDNNDNYVKTPIARNLLEPGLGRGLITAEGADWRRQRRIMAPPFAQKRLDAFAPGMVAEIDRMLAGWRAGTTLDIADAMSKLTLAVISRAMFSIDADGEVAKIGEGVGDYQHKVRPGFADLLGLPGWIPRTGVRAGRAALREIHPIIDSVIERRRRDGGPQDDFLALMLAARDEETGKGMSDEEMRAQIATIFTAGHETTAVALTWTWYLLAMHPWAEERLHAELDQVLGTRAPVAADMGRLKYTRMVIEESMRLYPPVHTMSRQALAEDVIAGHPIAKGTDVMVVPWLLQRHRKLWDEPDRFDPERFLPERSGNRHRFAYLPFGAGPRICIGMGFAMMEAVLLLARMAQSWRLALKPDQVVEPVGLITLRPKGGLPMRLVPREPLAAAAQ